MVILLTFALLFHSLHIVLLGILLSPYSRPSLTSRLKIANRSFYHSAPVLRNSLPSDLRHVAHHVTPLPTFNSPVSDISTSHFLKMVTPIYCASDSTYFVDIARVINYYLFTFTVIFLHSLYSPRLSQD